MHRPPLLKILRKDPVVAIATSDVHLSLHPPVARAEEEDWLEAQNRIWTEICSMANHHTCPVLCAGDLFDRWNAPAELINFAGMNLPHLYAIPGNHDLPNHREDMIHKSAFGTLMMAKKVDLLDVDSTTVEVNGTDLHLYGFPFEDSPPVPTKAKGLHIALIHEYIWIEEKGYKEAPKEQKLGIHHKRMFRGFDLVLVGDNHIPWEHQIEKGPMVVNCGTPIRRKSNEAYQQPRIVLIHASGEVESHLLDITKDKITEIDHGEEHGIEGLEEFIDELSHLESTNLNFREAVKQALARVKANKMVRQFVLEAME